MLTIAQIETPDDCDAIRLLINEFFEWAHTIDPSAGDASTFEGLQKELAGLPGIYGPPTGRFLLARVDGAPAGCVAFRKIGDTIAELKRMYIRPVYRGQKIGEKLVRQLLGDARDMGYGRIDLSSHASMIPAHSIYRRLGFSDCDPPPGFPDHERHKVVFMEMALD